MHEKAATLSTESIASSSPSSVETAERCASCGAPLVADQRYCLQCGERRVPVSDFLRGGAPSSSTPSATPPGAIPPLVKTASAGGSQQRNNALTVIAGVGVLLLAMGVGVLIGRAGGSKQAPAPAEVITVGSTAGAGGAGGTAEESFTDDWPSGTKGFTVQLEKLPQEGTTVKAVEQAKAAEGARGAGSVGALKSEDFSSLPSGSYIVYSGVYHKRAEAQKALGGLKRKFPGAAVIEVSNSSGKAGSGSSGSAGGSSGSGSSVTHPAPSSVLESLKGTKGKSYEEKSKNLPDVVSTG